MKYFIVWTTGFCGTIDNYYSAESEDDAYLSALQDFRHDDIEDVEEITEDDYILHH